MKKLSKSFKDVIINEEGQVAFEYFALVVIGVIAGVAIIPPVANLVGQMFQHGVVAEITKPFH